MPRIVLITTSYPSVAGDPSGHFVATEARALAREADVVVITARGRGREARPVADDERGRITVLRVDTGDAFGWPGVASRVRERPWRLASVAHWARRARLTLGSLGHFDRCIAHWAVPSAFPVARAVARPRGERAAPIEIVSHGADVRVLVRLPRVLRDVVMRRLLSDASSWRFVSVALHDDLARVLGSRDAARLATIARVAPAAIDLPDVRARSAELRAWRSGARVKVLVGRLVAEKCFDRALEAIAAQDACEVRGVRVVVVGDGPERGRLEALARALGMDARFVGLTSRDEALAWIGAADALVHASRTEGLSTVVREAEALGVRVEIVA